MLGTGLALLGAGWYVFQWALAALGLWIAWSRYGTKEDGSVLVVPPLAKEDCPGVSILRPLCGLDCNLYENLEASFLQQYPKFEIIFTVAEEGDEAIPIVQELMNKYPNRKARLIVGQENVGVNPKINNLIRAFREVVYDILWVIDSNVLTSTTTLQHSVSHLTMKPSAGQRPIGLVHHLPFAIYPDQNLGSRMEQVFLCSTHAKMYLAINYLAVASCVTGKSCLYRKSDLEKATENKRRSGKGLTLAEGEGGLAAFGKYLGEDNMVAEAIWQELGMRHAMGRDIAGNTVGSMSFQTYFRRRVRWIRVRKYMVVISTLLEPMTESILCGWIGMATFSKLINLSPWIFFPLHMVCWFILDVSVYQCLSASSPIMPREHAVYHDGPNGLSFLKAWAVRELMALPIWMFAMLGDTVGWRDNGKQYRVRKDGSVHLVDPSKERDGWAEETLRRVSDRIGERTYITISPDEENS